MDINLCQKLTLDPEGSGEDLYYQPIYDELRSLSKANGNGKKAQFEKLQKLSSDTLLKKSKDLQIALWFAKSIIKLNGLNGVDKSLNFIALFIQKCWGNMYPMINEDSSEKRFNLLQNFIKDLFLWLNELQITEGVEHTVDDWQKALYKKTYQQQVGDYDSIFNQLNNVSDSNKKTTIKYLQAIFIALNNLKNIVSKKISPLSTTKLDSLLKDWQKILLNCGTKNKTDSVNYESGQDKETQQKTSINSEGTRTVSDRASAYKAVREIALYLKTLDPHSLVPELLELATSWENLTMSEIINEIQNASPQTKYMLNMLTSTIQNSNEKSATR